MNKSGLIVYFFFIFIALLIRCEWKDFNIFLGMGAKVGEMTQGIVQQIPMGCKQQLKGKFYKIFILNGLCVIYISVVYTFNCIESDPL